MDTNQIASLIWNSTDLIFHLAIFLMLVNIYRKIDV